MLALLHLRAAMLTALSSKSLSEPTSMSMASSLPRRGARPRTGLISMRCTCLRSRLPKVIRWSPRISAARCSSAVATASGSISSQNPRLDFPSLSSGIAKVATLKVFPFAFLGSLSSTRRDVRFESISSTLSLAKVAASLSASSPAVSTAYAPSRSILSSASADSEPSAPTAPSPRMASSSPCFLLDTSNRRDSYVLVVSRR
mmetsp:Transcript_5306/g.16143  ORF Transcript_5306/g.16143 Transcript_5306/m.16143 type:complete len:202 (-) Transcript_5306:2285-2890(-)